MKLAAVVLAAGSGTRYGGGKLLAPWRGGVLLDGALAAACAAPVDKVYVTWGADPAVLAATTAFAVRAPKGERLVLVHAPRYDEGLSASLAAGVAAAPAEIDGVFVFLGDMPRIPVGLTARMAQALAAGADAVATEFEGRRGHPVLFGRRLLPQLTTLKGDRGAGELLSGLGEALKLIPAPDDGVLYDVDRPGDLA
ncbi:NTP transferase domain-containing protein [Phenylobacterium sp.]|uniref:nucleotidyltransferase family protein n=1 Tax=Phenylobacterium sp. TaxID=1871053 RepID=UPI0011F518C9|nr:NTP transferase domain-containing protein [Phenylobacterium sp.]THD58122.1 MAG: nucleotidyltransferase family protein [Phenylobacterium sp.]